MKGYKRLTEPENLDGYVEERCGSCHYYDKDKCTDKDCYEVIKHRLCKLEDKIEDGTLVEIAEIAKFFNKLWECPGDYIFDDKDVCDLIRENTEEDWCEKSCYTEDFSKCWEVYLRAKLKELQNESVESK